MRRFSFQFNRIWKTEETFTPEAFTLTLSVKKEWTYEYLTGKIAYSLLMLSEEAARVVFLASDRAQSFNQGLALCAIVDDECVVFAMR
jgi:hypothetical protein